MINKVKVLFNSSKPVTTPELEEILHHEKVNVSKTYFNKYKELLWCATLKKISMLFFLKRASQNCTQSGANRFCLRISKQKDPSYSVDVITRYLIRKNKILNLKSRSKMLVSECRIFSSMIIQKTSRSHLRTNTWSHRY